MTASARTQEFPPRSEPAALTRRPGLSARRAGHRKEPDERGVVWLGWEALLALPEAGEHAQVLGAGRWGRSAAHAPPTINDVSDHRHHADTAHRENFGLSTQEGGSCSRFRPRRQSTSWSDAPEPKPENRRRAAATTGAAKQPAACCPATRRACALTSSVPPS